MSQRKMIALFALVAAACSLTAVAQGFGPGPRGAEPPDPGPGLERLADLLDLDADQKEQWQATFEAHRQEMRARGEEARSVREAIRELASSDHPDLEQLGQLTLDLHHDMEAMKGLRDDLLESLEGILSPAQAESFRLLREARESFGARDRGMERRPDRGGRRGGRF